MAATNPRDRQERVYRLARWVLLLLAVIAALILGWRMLQPLSLQVAHPTRGPAVQAVYATGSVEASVTVRIAPQVGGRLVQLLADEGDAVQRGQVLARLDSSELQASLNDAQAQQKLAQRRLQRLQTLSGSGTATPDQLDQARATLASAGASVQRLQAQIDHMSLRASVAGQVIRRDGEVGEFIPVNQPVFYLAEAKVPLRVAADVDEEDIAGVRVGQRALITADAFPDRVFQGRVTGITPKGDPLARTYRVRIQLPTGTPLMIGMTTEANIILATHTDALLVPTTSLSGGGIWLVRNGRALLQPVKLGIKGLTRTEVLEGLKDNAQVIVQPPAGLVAGQRVRAEPASVDGGGP